MILLAAMDSALRGTLTAALMIVHRLRWRRTQPGRAGPPAGRLS